MMIKEPVIMMIDDDDDDRKMFFDAAKEVSETIQCITAEDGEQALKLLSSPLSELPDYIFLDLNMPRLNGKQCLAAMKKIERLENIPVIIFTTTRREEDVEETKRLGAVHFLTKPVLFEEICDAIRFVLAEDWKKN